MRSTLSRHLTYGNVIATIALFVALGGTTYAAVSLPRGSVGSKQLRSGAVSSTAVKDRSLQTRDLSLATRSSLKGMAGPAGPQGPAGPAAVRDFAVVQASGQFTRGTATSGGSTQAIGTYIVGFAQPVSTCAYTATLTADAAPPGRITVSDADGRVGVQTFDATGAPADRAFHLIVAC
jgi:hypothetical protein